MQAPDKRKYTSNVRDERNIWTLINMDITELRVQEHIFSKLVYEEDHAKGVKNREVEFIRTVQKCNLDYVHGGVEQGRKCSATNIHISPDR